MKLKKILEWLMFIVGILGAIYFTLVFLPAKSNVISDVSYVEPIPIPPVISEALQNLINAQSQNGIFRDLSNSKPPMSLKIPIINVDATVEYVGLTSSGAMDVPKGPDNVAWFDLGPIPGNEGSAVIAGHYGWKNNIPAVFDNLNKLKKGDKIYIVDNIGATTTFVVKEIGIYDQNGDASNVFGSNDGKAHLNLITCEGVWNATLKSRPGRLVVFTDKL